MFITLNELLINFKTLVDGKYNDYLLDHGVLHNFFSVNWCDQNGLENEWGKWFSIQMAEGQEVPAVSKLRCLVDLGPMKAALTFYVLNCNLLCLLGLPLGIRPLEILISGLAP